MDHRIGRRWPTDLPVRVARETDATARPARLLDLSLNGGCLQLHHPMIGPGKALEVWLPLTSVPVRALVVYTNGGRAGLLWFERCRRLDRLLGAVQRHPLAAREGDLEALGQRGDHPKKGSSTADFTD